jgi:hypothetical protein
MHGEGCSPVPPSERRQWLLALGLFLLAVVVLVAILSGAMRFSASGPAVDDPPIVPVRVATPTVANAVQAAVLRTKKTSAVHYVRVASLRGSAVGSSETVGMGYTSSRTVAFGGKTGRAGGKGPPVAASAANRQWGGAGASSVGQAEVPISAAWEAGFYPIYGEAQHVFGVDWLLLASIHKQESAFSTAPSTYQHGRRPTVYDHRTARHPSIYDDFDSIMAAAWLLSSDGASLALDDSAWGAAYDYYGHDAAGIEYADTVLARAIGWSQHGFCINCGVEPAMINAVYEAYGAPVIAKYSRPGLAREHAPPLVGVR